MTLARVPQAIDYFGAPGTNVRFPPIAAIGEPLHRRRMESCCCRSLADFAVVPMGGDGLDERVFETLERARDHGGDLWWLYQSKCSACDQEWLVAQDERIYDNFYLKRINPTEARGIREDNRWPDDFITYERVLRLGRTLSQPWTFLDPRSPALVWTAGDLLKERPDITVEEIAYLLAIEPKAGARLLPS